MKRFVSRLAFLTIAPLIALTAACDRHPLDQAHDHTLGRVDIIDRGQTERPVVASWTPQTGWTGTIPDISLSSERQRISLGARIYNHDGHERSLARDGEYSVRWAMAPNAPTGIVVADDSAGERFHGDHIHIYGQAAGTTQIQFVLWHIDHADGESAPVQVRVVD